MNFAIGRTDYFKALGFNTDYWRKSLDGKYSMCHAEFALTLADKKYLDIYQHDSQEFLDIINGAEWTEQAEVEEEEEIVEEEEEDNE